MASPGRQRAAVQAKSYIRGCLAIGTSILAAQLAHNQHLFCLLLLTKKTLGEEEAPRDDRSKGRGEGREEKQKATDWPRDLYRCQYSYTHSIMK